MNDPKLVIPNETHESAYNDMMDEWETFGGRLHPGGIRRKGLAYSEWLKVISARRCAQTCPPDRVVEDLFFFMNSSRLCGAVSIRHVLNDELLFRGGHIGYGIRPSERGKGYGKRQLALALDYCREHLTDRRVLVTCAKENPASAGVILANGGKLENEVVDEGEILQRYWITL